jgi:hypothetical protein
METWICIVLLVQKKRLSYLRELGATARRKKERGEAGKKEGVEDNIGGPRFPLYIGRTRGFVSEFHTPGNVQPFLLPFQLYFQSL